MCLKSISKSNIYSMWHNFLCNLQWMKWCLSLTPSNAAPSSWELGPLSISSIIIVICETFSRQLCQYFSLVDGALTRYYNYNYLQTILVMQNFTAKSRCRHDMMQICQCPWEITGTGAGAAICLTRDWGWLRQLARAIIEFPFVRVSFRLLGDCIQQAAMQHIYRDSRPLGSSIV